LLYHIQVSERNFQFAFVLVMPLEVKIHKQDNTVLDGEASQLEKGRFFIYVVSAVCSMYVVCIVTHRSKQQSVPKHGKIL
jgi:hypothetical protein